jgi:hypothetical protein
LASSDGFFILIAVLFRRFVDGCSQFIMVKSKAFFSEFRRGICVSATPGEDFVKGVISR